MIMRKRWVKALIAMIALVAMMTETTYSAVAAVSTEYVSQDNTDTSQEVTITESDSTQTDTVTEAETGGEIQDSTSEIVTDSTTDSTTDSVTDPTTDSVTDSVTDSSSDTPVLDVSPTAPIDGTVTEVLPEQPVTDEETNTVEKKLESYEDRIEGIGLQDVMLYVNTDQMNETDRFKLSLEGSASMQYDAVLSSEMSKANSNIYSITGLNNEQFRVYVATISEGMSVNYSIREDGNPQITLISAPEEEIQKKLEVSSDGTQITGEGYDDITLSFETTELPDENYFSLNVNTPAEVSYNGSKIVNGSIPSLSNTTSSVRLSSLDKKAFSIYIAGENIDAVNAVYSVDSVDNGAARIVVALGDGAQKVQSLTASTDGITGSGYEKLELSMEYIKNVIEEAKKEAEATAEAAKNAETDGAADENTVFNYTLHVETKATQVSINGQMLTNGAIDYTDTMESVIIDGLEEESFKIYAVAKDEVKSESTENSAEPTQIAYSVQSVENGTAKITFTYFAEGEKFEKKVYEYEDSSVKVTATLQHVDAIPDDADFVVTPVTPDTPGYNYDAYMQALNNHADTIATEEDSNTADTAGDKFTNKNTLLYDIAFLCEDEEGKYVEFQPESGSVRIDISFKQNQLKEDIKAESGEEVTVVHLPLADAVKESVDTTADATGISASDVKIEVVSDSTDVDSEVTSFDLTNFSVAALTASGIILKPGANHTFRDVLGKAVNYGVVVNELAISSHMDSNFATGLYTGTASNVTAGAYTGNHNPGNYILAEYTGQNGFFTESNSSGNKYILYTTEAALSKMASLKMLQEHGAVVDTSKSAAELKSAVSSMVSGTLSSTLVSAGESGGYDFDDLAVYGTDQKYLLDISAGEAGTYYVNFESGEYESKLGQASKLKIKKNADQTIVFNIPDSSVNFHQFLVSNGDANFSSSSDSSSSAAVFAKSIIWNAYNATSASTPDGVFGVFLCPNADFSIGTTSTGWVVANKLTNGGEWHCVWEGMPSFDPSGVQITAKKTIDDKEPVSGEVFNFTLEKYENGSWNVIQTKTNNGSEISFDEINFTESDGSNTYYYRVKESATSLSGYTYDTTSYIVKVDLTLSTYLDSKVQMANATYFKGSDINATEAVSEITFNNKVEQGELTVKKVLTGSTVAKNFYFTVTGPSGAVKNAEGSTVFTVAANDSTGTKITGLPYGEYTVTETDASGTALTEGSPYHITYSSRTVTLDSTKNKADVTITNALGSLTVKKVRDGGTDETFYFTVKDSSGNLIKTAQNGTVWSVVANGQTVISELPFGNYTITEVKDSAGNEIDDAFGYVVTYANTNQIAAVTTEKPAVEFVITNKEKQKGEVTVVKEDYSDCYFLADATFRLYESNGTPVYVTGDNGEYTYSDSVTGKLDMVTAGTGGALIVKDLPWGSYYFKETNPPAGYKYNSDIVLSFIVNEKGTTNTTTNLIGTLIKPENSGYSLKYIVMNERKPFRLKITKTYTSSNGQVTALGGVEFTLYKYNEQTSRYEYYAKGLTAPDGTYTFENLPWGSYKYEESGIPEGYTVTDSSTGEFIINAKSEIFTCGNPCSMPIYDVAVDNRPISGGVELTKTSDSNKALSGAKFELWKNGTNGAANATIIYATDKGSGNYEYSMTAAGAKSTFVTNQSGKINVTKLPAGTYFFKEIEAPAGYVAVTGNVGGFTIDKEAETEKVTVVNTTFKASVTFTKVDGSDNSIKLAGTKFALWYRAVGAGDYTKLSDVEANASGVVLVDGLALGDYYFVETQAKTGYVLDQTKRYFTIENSNAGKIVTLSGTGITEGLVGNRRERGQVSLQKTSENGTALNGVEFELWSDSSEYSGLASDGYRKVTTVKTSGNGEISIDDLPWGHYYLVEKKTVVGYQLDSTKHYFEINAANLDVKFEGNNKITNKAIKGYVELLKTDKDDLAIALNGVSFALYKKASATNGTDTYIDTFVTENGKIAKEKIGALEYGDYYFVETATITGYLLDTTTHYDFSITEQDAVVTVSASNERALGKVTLEKSDEAQSKLLSGAVYELYSTNTNNVFQSIQNIFGKDYHKYGEYTLTDGSITIDNLPWGDYYFVEKIAPTGYELDTDTKYQFTISADSLDVQLTRANSSAATDKEQKGSIQLVKSGKDGEKLKGAEFALYKDDERYPNSTTTYTTDDKGTVTLDNLPFGTYYFIEISAPEGYETPTGDAAKTSSVTISASNTGTEITADRTIQFSNNAISGGLELYKVDAKSSALSGATFYMTTVENGSERNVKVSGSAGTYTFDSVGALLSSKVIMDTTDAGKLSVTGLPYGTYRVYEETAPAGYNKKESPYEFIIDSQGKVVTSNFVNTEIQAGVKFLKVDAEHELLGGAVFRLFNADTNTDLGTVTVDTNGRNKGIAEVKGLGAGNYYFVEESAPNGYDIVLVSGEAKRYTFSITANDNGKTVGLTNADITLDGVGAVVNTPKLGDARLTKLIDGTNTGLAGAKFNVFRDGDTSPIKSGLESDSDGYVNATGLEWGNYYFVETAAPKGYALDETHYEFTVDATNVSALIVTGKKGSPLVAKNKLILGSAKLTKYDSVTNDKLAGALFDVFDSTTGQIVTGYENGILSDANGVVLTRKDIPKGSYYFKERTAPTGYALDSTEYTFVIDQDNMDTVVLAGTNGKANNEPLLGKAELFKYVLGTDGITQTGLDGAKFELYKKNSSGIFNLFSKNVGEYSTSAAGLITVEDLPWGEYYFKETVPPAGYEKLPDSENQFEFTISATQLDYTGAERLTVANEKYKGSVMLVKTETGNTDQKIEGAVFKFYKIVQGSSVEIPNTKSAYGTYITDKDGEITVTDLDWGEYYFEEISAPEGYALPATTKTETCEITKDNVAASVSAPLTISVDNEKIYGNVELTKVDDATPANVLAGAQFELYKKTGEAVYVSGSAGNYTYSTTATDAVLETQLDGKLVVKQLPYGEYYFKETHAPKGFIIKSSNIEFSITENQTADAAPAVTISHINSKVSAGVSFVKVDTSVDKPLKGVVFTLYKVGAGAGGADLELSDYTSNDNGIISATGLGVGNYYFKEKSTPNDAYRKSSTEYTFTIDTEDNGTVVGIDNADTVVDGNGIVINYPKYGSVKLVKRATVNGASTGTLAGAAFDLYKGNASNPGADPLTQGTFVSSHTVDSNGEINISNLEWGDYFFIETSAPAGYTIEKNSGGYNRPYNFSISAANVMNVQTVNANNEKQSGSVDLEKISSADNSYLKDVSFNLYKDYNSSSQELIATLTTDANGKASKDGLAWGNYTLIEKDTLSGYVKDTTERTFEISGTHLKQTYTGGSAIKNDKIQGFVELEKKDGTTSEAMSGVEFKLYSTASATKTYIGTFATGTNGRFASVTDIAAAYQSVGVGSDGKVGPLDMGSYVFEETTPAGYEEYTDNLAFTINTNKQVVSFTGNNAIKNTRNTGSVKLKKVDENGAALANAQFTLTAKTPNNFSQTLQTLIHGTYTNGVYYTNENGELEISGLPWDTYYIQETEAPQGYTIVDATKHEFIINEQNTSKKIDLGTFENTKQKGSIILTKTDAETSAVLAGAEFKLYLKSTDGKVSDVSSLYGAKDGVFTTTADGTITVSGLEWGTYYFQETKAPVGYEAITATNVVKSSDVTIDASNVNAISKLMQQQSVGVTNAKGYGFVSLRKTFDGTQPESLSGIGFTLVNKDTNSTVGEYKTDADGVISAAVIGRLPYGNYYFTETSVPVGVSYSVSDFKLEFSITSSYPIADAVEYTFTNSEIKAGARFSKVDADSKDIISGIVFDVLNATNDSSVTQVTSDAQGLVVVTGLPMGNYYFLENAASATAAGYTPDTTKYYFDITDKDTQTENADGTKTEKFVDVYMLDASGNHAAVTTVENTKNNGSIELVKLGKGSNGISTPISFTDAEFELYKDGTLYKNAEELKAMYSSDKLVVSDLPWGTYYFLETKAPAGYALPTGDAAKTNEVVLDGTTVAGSAATPLTCQLTDDTNKLYISKREIGGTDELTGAHMELYLADSAGKRTGTALASWTSGTTSKLFEIGSELGSGLVAGQTYVLHENTAPLGYALTADIVFTVNEDGSITTSSRTSGSKNGMTLIMEDSLLDLEISKKELGLDKELVGAALVIKKGSEEVEKWTSTGQPHKIKAALEVGTAYTLVEEGAPKGYYTAQPITFELLDNGSLRVTADASSTAEVKSISKLSDYDVPVYTNSLTMFDRPIRVEISKKRLTGGTDDYVKGAGLTLYEKNAQGGWDNIYSWTSPESGAVLMEYGKLQVNNSYKVVETYVPAGYVKAEDVIFTVNDYSSFTQTDANGQVTQKVDVLDGLTKVIVSKQSVSGTDELEGAKLQITDKDGNVIATWTSGSKPVAFTSAKEGELSAGELASYSGYTVIYGVAFVAGESYTLTELSSPDGFALATPITFKVDDMGVTSPSPIVMKDKPLEIALSKQDLSGHMLNGAKMQLIDMSGTVVHEWISSNKPVLFTQRTLSPSEAAKYAEVVQTILMETKDDTKPYTYKLHEVSAPTGYDVASDMTFTIKGSDVVADNGEVRTEVMKDAEGGEVKLEGTKSWIIPKNPDGSAIAGYTYPDVTIELYRDSSTKGTMDATPIDTLVLSNGAENYAFGPLEQYKYKTTGGVDYEYTYTVKEKMSSDAAAKFDSEEKTDDTGKVVGFTNRLKQEKTYLNGEKVWVLYRDKNGNIDRTKDYADVIIYLLRDGARVDADGDGKDDSVIIKNGAAGTNGKEIFRFSDLDKYDLTTGKEYSYTVEEVGDPSGTYSSEITYMEHACKVINIPFHDPFRISGTKLWVDPKGSARPDVTIELYRDGKLYQTTKLKADNTFEFSGLYEYNLGWSNDADDNKATADGHKFVYTLKETGAANYTFEVDFNGTKATLNSAGLAVFEGEVPDSNIVSAEITNTIKQEYIELSGTKFWNDAGDASRRPTVTIHLYATDTAGRNHTLVDTYLLDNTSRTYSFGTPGRVQLPKYDANGQEITYSVEEEALTGYVSSKSGNDFTNTPSKVRVSKLDATTSAELPGAVLALTRVSTGTEVERWTSTTAPHYVEGLAIGEEYRLTEISAPTGYSVASPVTFTVRSDGVEQTVVMRDDRIVGSVTLTKRDASTRDALSGAVFNLYTSTGTIVRATGSAGSYSYSASTAGTTSLEVSSAGTLSVRDLPYGTYYFREIKAPSGYDLGTATESFTIAEAGAAPTVTFLNTRSVGAVRLLKANGTATTALSGAVFELYSKTPRTISQAAAATIYTDVYYLYGTYTTNSAGEIYVGDLPWDDYYFIEVTAPTGYTINRDTNGDPLVYTFSVDSTSAASVAASLGTITNQTGGGSGGSSGGGSEGGVAGARREGGVLSGVLGVRAAPTSGVLGERVGPVTGDAANIALWIILLVVSVAIIVFICVQNKSHKKVRGKSRRS